MCDLLLGVLQHWLLFTILKKAWYALDFLYQIWFTFYKQQVNKIKWKVIIAHLHLISQSIGKYSGQKPLFLPHLPNFETLISSLIFISEKFVVVIIVIIFTYVFVEY